MKCFTTQGYLRTWQLSVYMTIIKYMYCKVSSQIIFLIHFGSLFVYMLITFAVFHIQFSNIKTLTYIRLVFGNQINFPKEMTSMILVEKQKKIPPFP